MIISKMIDLEFTNDSKKIENELKKRGIDPLRWAVVDASDEKLILSVTYQVY